jgi:DNA polymerase I-like protein with 3'-5' exonuclease and polymerase domains
MPKTWVFADYSQAEPRVVAWAGPVPKLQEWFRSGEDVHTNVTRMLARAVQERQLHLPGELFWRKPWSEYTKSDPERQVGKNTVNANNYGMGKRRFSVVTGLPERYADIVQGIYFALFPEIRTGYHKFIDRQLPRITIPQGWPIHFMTPIDDDLKRKAYSLYAQSTVGLMITDTLCDVSETFGVDMTARVTPEAIASWGYNVDLQIHDAIAVACDEVEVPAVVKTIRSYGERPITVRGEPLTIPMDFKVGPNWKDLENYKP